MKKRKATRRAKATKKKRKVAKKRKRNPARRNPIIGDMAMALTYKGGEGKRHGHMKGPWEHEFETDDVQIEGLPNGSIVLKSRSGKRLWDYFEVER